MHGMITMQIVPTQICECRGMKNRNTIKVLLRTCLRNLDYIKAGLQMFWYKVVGTVFCLTTSRNRLFAWERNTSRIRHSASAYISSVSGTTTSHRFCAPRFGALPSSRRLPAAPAEPCARRLPPSASRTSSTCAKTVAADPMAVRRDPSALLEDKTRIHTRLRLLSEYGRNVADECWRCKRTRVAWASSSSHLYTRKTVTGQERTARRHITSVPDDVMRRVSLGNV